MDRYSNRRQAGAELAGHLSALAGRDDVVVLALPRGGVPVGYEVARALDAPLDVFVVRKLGVPGQEELAMGAVASGGVRVLNDSVLASIEISPEAIDHVTALEQGELARRELAYRSGRPPLVLAGKVAILVDDGLATGSTMQAAVHAARKLDPARIIVAVPVGARESSASLRAIADEVVCPLIPRDFSSVGQWYDDFSQTEDAEVRALLDAARAESVQPGRT